MVTSILFFSASLSTFFIKSFYHFFTSCDRLFIYPALVKLMDAKIHLESEPNEGTNIAVRIPQKTLGAKPLGKELSNRLENFEIGTWQTNFDFEPTIFQNGKVLVVDDIDINLEVAKAMLEFFGLEVETCTSGKAVINLIKQGNKYDIIFLDHMMPDMDGMQTANTLREIGYNQPIVALTANALKGQAEIFMENGFDGFMSKPMDINHLNSYLVRFIG